VNSAQEIVVVADSSKWGVVGLADIGPLEIAATIVTDSGISRDALRVLEEAVETVLVVDVPQ
jgi:DeoR/GlpR family transcriptional regulator of sugar metabolism